MRSGLILFLPTTGLSVHFDGIWPNGWQSWSILSPGPWNRASFVVKPEDDLPERAWETAQRFLVPDLAEGSSN